MSANGANRMQLDILRSLNLKLSIFERLNFHANNRKEFIVPVVANLLKVKNPTCTIVAGCPHIPREQGSVESGKKIL